jgi:hypothetical protein
VHREALTVAKEVARAVIAENFIAGFEMSG